MATAERLLTLYVLLASTGYYTKMISNKEEITHNLIYQRVTGVIHP